ncbi:hypothetical protein FCV25MIE_33181 [Fagus crenata]
MASGVTLRGSVSPSPSPTTTESTTDLHLPNCADPPLIVGYPSEAGVDVHLRAKVSSLECVGAKASTPDWIGALSRGREDSGSTWDVDAPREQSGFHWNRSRVGFG